MTEKRYKPKMIKDCYDCYNQYQANELFNQDCAIFQDTLRLNDKYVNKCIWISVIEKEHENFYNNLTELINSNPFMNLDKLCDEIREDNYFLEYSKVMKGGLSK